MLKVSVRNGYSDRNGIATENNKMQYKGFDARTRIKIQNKITKICESCFHGDDYNYRNTRQKFYRFVLGEIYSLPVDFRRDYSYEEIWTEIIDTIKNDSYDAVLTIVEAISVYCDDYLKENLSGYYNPYSHRYKGESVFSTINSMFEKEYVGYRFIDGMITPITDDIEIAEIETVITSVDAEIKIHIKKAIAHLSNRECPDYENSIKESICAVEALCKQITKSSGKDATLGKTLSRLESEGLLIHGSLKQGFSSLYGFTSDARGIRHAGDMGGPGSTFEEAHFMLVSCSAFINYLLAVSKD